MKQVLKLDNIISSISLSNSLWQEKLWHCWEKGNEAGLGFALGESFDQSIEALTKEGYDLIAEINGLVIGTNGLNSIIAVVNIYGPWAVDITAELLASNYSPVQTPFPFSRHSYVS